MLDAWYCSKGNKTEFGKYSYFGQCLEVLIFWRPQDKIVMGWVVSRLPSGEGTSHQPQFGHHFILLQPFLQLHALLHPETQPAATAACAMTLPFPLVSLAPDTTPDMRVAEQCTLGNLPLTARQSEQASGQCQREKVFANSPQTPAKVGDSQTWERVLIDKQRQMTTTKSNIVLNMVLYQNTIKCQFCFITCIFYFETMRYSNIIARNLNLLVSILLNSLIQSIQ